MQSGLAITGSSGKLGLHVIRLVGSNDNTIICIDMVDPPLPLPPNAEFRRTDLRDYQQTLIALNGCDKLIHLAAIPSPRGHDDWDVHNSNVVVSYNVLRAAAEVGIKRVTLASSVNAVGGVWSRQPSFDYFPLDEEVRCFAEDPYSLSKWVAESQAASISRRFGLRIASLRLHHCVDEPSTGRSSKWAACDLWGYVLNSSAAEACLLGLTSEGWEGHEVFYIVSPVQSGIKSSEDLRNEYWSDVPIKADYVFHGNEAFYNCTKAKTLLGWEHKPVEEKDRQ